MPKELMSVAQARANAEECMRAAATSTDREIIEVYERLAESWNDLAEELEKIPKR